MQGIEKSHCNAAIDAVLTAYYGVMSTTIEEVGRSISKTFGKGDTLVVDGTPEILLTSHLRRYDRQAIIITEEIGTDDLAKLEPDAEDPRRFRTIFISDPMDRSNIFNTFLAGFDRTKYLSEIMSDPETKKAWESANGSPAEITGASSAITCVRRGLPIFSVMVNYITQQMIVSCGAGNFILALSKDRQKIDLEHVIKSAKRLTFRTMTEDHKTSMRRFVTFTGKSGYLESLQASNLMKPEELEANLYYSLPGGPLRILYLSTLQPESVPIGFILANGEKIGEWIHWLPFVRFVREQSEDDESALRLYEVFQDVLRIKDTALMSTPPAYSIFQPSSFVNSRTVVDVRRIGAFVNPSKIRSTILVVPKSNELMTLLTRQYGHREIEFANNW